MSAADLAFWLVASHQQGVGAGLHCGSMQLRAASGVEPLCLAHCGLDRYPAARTQVIPLSLDRHCSDVLVISLARVLDNVLAGRVPATVRIKMCQLEFDMGGPTWQLDPQQKFAPPVKLHNQHIGVHFLMLSQISLVRSYIDSPCICSRNEWQTLWSTA